ncbi:MAG: transglycosylase SLT domain-containing protein [Paludibacter sp.]|jgi:membrane-bound lytic murein transglycosylase D|nr:transglycosylase SLT domain-containing protein [Bacteroidales bacterium]
MFSKKIFIILALLFPTCPALAETDTEIPLPATDVKISEESVDSIAVDSIPIPDEVTYALDHMLSSWYQDKAKKSQCDTAALDVQVPDSVVKLRLSLMPCVIEMPYNRHVRSFIDLYVVKRRSQVSYFRRLGDYYFRLFEQALDKHDLPFELKYLPVIESALNATAVSRAGAAGLWQFMVSTGRMYGLEINSLIDERMDPYKSTHAAVKYLKDLYEIYGDWHLVIAAYNCGPGNVNKAIRRSGGKQDYWAIYPFLPAETRGYVPIFIAANYALYYAEAHNICKADVEFPNPIDTVIINQRIHFEQIASVLNVPKEQIKMLNPQYRREIIPGDLKPYAVALPVSLTGMFIDKFDEIVAYKADSLINNRRVEVNTALAPVIYHTVRSGQTLSGIAARYGVSVTRLRQWNNIRGSLIRPGQRIKIYR